jgi:hypothetical protein
MFENDFVTQLVVVLDTDTVDEAVHKVAAQVMARRVPPRDARLMVRLGDRVVPSDVTTWTPLSPPSWMTTPVRRSPSWTGGPTPGSAVMAGYG